MFGYKEMLFIGYTIFPDGNDYSAKTVGLDTICVRYLVIR
jgi:hypothetical protein